MTGHAAGPPAQAHRRSRARGLIALGSVLAVALLVLGTRAVLTGVRDDDASPSPVTGASGSPADEPTPSGEPQPSAEPSPTEEGSGDRPARDRLTVSASGLGPLTVGLPPASNPGAAMITWDADHCADLRPEDPGRWVSTYDDFDRPDLGDTFPIFGVAGADRVEWIDVFDPSIPTTEDIRQGSTLAELRAAYPDLVRGAVNVYAQAWWVSTDDGTLKFQTAATGEVTSGSPDAPVELISVLAPGNDPDFTTLDTDWTAGSCL